jgi:hypothetical protein
MMEFGALGAASMRPGLLAAPEGRKKLHRQKLEKSPAYIVSE